MQAQTATLTWNLIADMITALLFTGLVLKSLPILWRQRYGDFIKRGSWICKVTEFFPMPVLLLALFFSLRGVSINQYPYAIPELLTLTITSFLYIKKRNTILGFFSGFVVYMILVTIYFGQ